MKTSRIHIYVVMLICLTLTATHCQKNENVVQDTQTAPDLILSGQAYTVQRGTVVKTLEFAGEIAPIEEVSLYFKTDGYVKSVFVEPGDEVKRGDILAELEVEDPQMVSTELNLAAAQARLAQAQRENAYAITGAELALQQATADLEYIKTQEGSYPSALDYQHDLKIVETAVNAATLELEYLRQGVNPGLEIEVQRAQELMAWMQIIAPSDGEVAVVSVYPGRPVQWFRPVIIVADVSSIEVSAMLPNDQLQSLSEGLEVRITSDEDPTREWTGVIRSLPFPFGTGGSRSSGIDASDDVRIQLDDPGEDFTLNEQVHVTVILEKRENVLWLPPEAVQSLQGRHFVVVYDETRQHRVDVQLGLDGGDRLEILDGVEEDFIIITPQGI